MPERFWRTASQSYLRPFASRVGVSARGKSRCLQRVLCDFGTEESFEQADARLREHYGFSVGASAVRAVTLQHAQRAACRLEAEYAQSFRLLPRHGAAQMVAEADGTMLCTVEGGNPRRGRRPRQWKEMRLLAAQEHEEVETTYAATFGAVEEAGRRWGHAARQAGWALESRIHVVADGAEWIGRQSVEVFGAQARLLVDFYHVSEYLAAASARCAPQAPGVWRQEQQERLKEGASQEVLAALAVHLEPATVADEEAPVRAAHRYLSRRLDALGYPQALAAGLPIGSGLIESGHKHVLQARLKKAGSAWLPAHADAMAQLRVLRANGQWESFWPASQAA